MPRTKTEQVSLRFSTEEKNALKEKCTLARMSMSEYILTLSKKTKIIVPVKLPHLLLEITRIGTNINQVAAVANSKGSVNEFQIRMLIESLNEVKQLLGKVLNEFYGNNNISPKSNQN
jgi:hypothetical protein